MQLAVNNKKSQIYVQDEDWDKINKFIVCFCLREAEGYNNPVTVKYGFQWTAALSTSRGDCLKLSCLNFWRLDVQQTAGDLHYIYPPVNKTIPSAWSQLESFNKLFSPRCPDYDTHWKLLKIHAGAWCFPWNVLLFPCAAAAVAPQRARISSSGGLSALLCCINDSERSWNPLLNETCGSKTG